MRGQPTRSATKANSLYASHTDGCKETEKRREDKKRDTREFHTLKRTRFSYRPKSNKTTENEANRNANRKEDGE